MDVEFTVTPAPGNPLGVKGIGENGTLGPPAAIVNAVTDALSPFGVRHVETPVTAETVWEAVDR
jgi:carbon-monoxide dehydrogenase large subunit